MSFDPPDPKRAPKTSAIIQRHIADNEKAGWHVRFRDAMKQTQELIEHAIATEQLLREVAADLYSIAPDLEKVASELHRKLVDYFKEPK